MRRHLDIGIALLFAFAAAVACAQASKEQVVTAAARCDKEVRDYLETLRYIRESAGVQIGNRVAAGYVGEEALRKVQAEQGSCAAAQLIREKMARRG